MARRCQEGKPEVVVALAFVVVGRSGIAVDRLCHVRKMILGNAQGNQRTVVAELLRVEKRTDAPEISLAFQIVQTAEHVLLRRLKHFTQTRKRP